MMKVWIVYCDGFHGYEGVYDSEEKANEVVDTYADNLYDAWVEEVEVK